MGEGWLWFLAFSNSYGVNYAIFSPLLISSNLEFCNWPLRFLSFERLTRWTGTAYLGTLLPMSKAWERIIPTALFVAVKSWIQPKCPLTEGCSKSEIQRNTVQPLKRWGNFTYWKISKKKKERKKEKSLRDWMKKARYRMVEQRSQTIHFIWVIKWMSKSS